MRKILFVLCMGTALLLTQGAAVSASEIICTLSSSASTTGCVAVQAGFVAFAPSVTPPAGTYNAAQNVALSAEQATTIRYTADGTTPSCATGSVYSAPIAVKKTQTIRAIACYPSNTSSPISTFSYLLTIFDARTENASLTASSAGAAAALPAQATSVTLSNTTVLDISSAVATSSAGAITIGGVTKTLASFTSGNLTAVDLSVPIMVGGASVSVGRAVAIQSGVSGTPTTISNSDFSRASALIPDGASVLAGAGWNGTILPPKAGSGAGAAPAGFSVGETVVEIGSNTETLLFDTPVSVVLSGVTGTVGYKPAGSSVWVQIGNQCGGTYGAPSSPAFPSECAISNGTDTKIYTFHFTSFAGLNGLSGGNSLPPGGNGPVGASASRASDINGDGRVDIFDFNLLFAAWGMEKTGPFYAGADLNQDGGIDVSDFTILLAHWSE